MKRLAAVTLSLCMWYGPLASAQTPAGGQPQGAAAQAAPGATPESADAKPAAKDRGKGEEAKPAAQAQPAAKPEEAEPAPQAARPAAKPQEAQPAATPQAAPVAQPPQVAPTTGQVEVRGQVGATVSVDGEPKGKLPMPGGLTLSPGTHQLKVEIDGYEPFSAQIVVTAGQTTKVQAVMKKLPPKSASKGTVKLTMKLDQAKVTIDGKQVSPSEDGTVQVEQGQHDVKVTRKGFKPIEQKVALTSGATVTVGGKWEPESEGDGLAPYVTMVLGAGMIGLGATFSADSGDAETEGVRTMGTTEDDKEIAAATLYTIGGVLVATGVTMLVLDLAEGDDTDGAQASLFELPGGLGVTPVAGPDTAGITLSTTF